MKVREVHYQEDGENGMQTNKTIGLLNGYKATILIQTHPPAQRQLIKKVVEQN